MEQEERIEKISKLFFSLKDFLDNYTKDWNEDISAIKVKVLADYMAMIIFSSIKKEDTRKVLDILLKDIYEIIMKAHEEIGKNIDLQIH